jgi:zinc protease
MPDRRRRICAIVRGAILTLLMHAGFASPALCYAKDARQGQLENGLTYFIDPAPTDDGKISFSLIVRVGSRQTLPREQQVAHIIEHIVLMNAAAADRKGSMPSRIEALGSRWGADANAATGEDFTTFFVKLPAINPTALDTGLDILGDWIGPRALSDAEIERETRAVIEELRPGGSSESLIRLSAQHHIWFAGSPFFDFARDLPGTVSATPSGIRSLYDAWYRPPSMAVIVQGNVDPDIILAELSRRLAGVARGAPAPQRAHAGILPVAGGHYAPIPSQGSAESSLEITYKYRPRPAGSFERIKEKAIDLIIEQAVNDALAGLSESSDAPTLGIGLRMASSFEYPGVGILSLGANIVPGAMRGALAELLKVDASLRRDGPDATGVGNARLKVIGALEGMADDPAERFRSQFIKGASDPSPKELREAVRQVTVAEVKEYLSRRLDPANRDVFAFYPGTDDASVPDAGEFEALRRAAERSPAMQLAAPAIKEPTFLPYASTKIEARPGISEAHGYYRWRLPRSGATLLVRRIDSGSVTVEMARLAGTSSVEPAYRVAASRAQNLIALSGLAGLDSSQLARFYSERGISVEVRLQPDRVGVRAAAPADQWPMLANLIRAQIVSPPCRMDLPVSDPSERNSQENSDPTAVVREAFNRLIDQSLSGQPKADLAPAAAPTPGAVCRQFSRLLGDTHAMVIAIEGPVDPKSVYETVAQALDLPASGASLPRPTVRPVVATRAGRDVLRLGTDKSANVFLALQWESTEDERPGLLALAALKQRMMHRLRSVEKGAYYISPGFEPKNRHGAAVLSIAFDTAPENVDRMIAAAREELQRLRLDGVSAQELATARSLVVEEAMTPAQVTEIWLQRGTLRSRAPVSDAAVSAWIERNIDLSRLHEFVRIPRS